VVIPGTIKKHVSNPLGRLGAADRTEPSPERASWA